MITFHVAGGMKRNVRGINVYFAAVHKIYLQKQCMIEPYIIAKVDELVKEK